MIYERCMLESGSKGKMYIHFDFELKFSFTPSPPTLLLEKIEEKATYFLHS